MDVGDFRRFAGVAMSCPSPCRVFPTISILTKTPGWSLYSRYPSSAHPKCAGGDMWLLSCSNHRLDTQIQFRLTASLAHRIGVRVTDLSFGRLSWFGQRAASVACSPPAPPVAASHQPYTRGVVCIRRGADRYSARFPAGKQRRGNSEDVVLWASRKFYVTAERSLSCVPALSECNRLAEAVINARRGPSE